MIYKQNRFRRFAYKKELNVRKFKLEDLARLNKTGEVYTEKPWYRFLKQRWSTNFDSLEKFYMKIKIRHNETGEFSMKYLRYNINPLNVCTDIHSLQV